jgi:enhancing lycopene biosynthesis protein 2
LSGTGWQYSSAIDKAAEYGATVVEMNVTDVCIDEENKLVSCPAFMYTMAKFHEIADGLAWMIEETLKMADDDDDDDS